MVKKSAGWFEYDAHATGRVRRRRPDRARRPVSKLPQAQAQAQAEVRDNPAPGVPSGPQAMP
jgi:hypothetical protein